MSSRLNSVIIFQDMYSFFYKTTNGLAFGFLWGNCLPLFYFHLTNPLLMLWTSDTAFSPLFLGPFLWERLDFGTFVCEASNNVPKISGWAGFFCVWFLIYGMMYYRALWLCVKCEVLHCPSMANDLAFKFQKKQRGNSVGAPFYYREREDRRRAWKCLSKIPVHECCRLTFPGAKFW